MDPISPESQTSGVDDVEPKAPSETELVTEPEADPAMGSMAAAQSAARAAKPKLWQQVQSLVRGVAESERWDKIRIAEDMAVRASLRFGSTQSIYEQEYTAGLATEQARSLLLRASTAEERVTLDHDVEASMTEIAQRMETVQKLANSPESQA